MPPLSEFNHELLTVRLLNGPLLFVSLPSGIVTTHDKL